MFRYLSRKFVENRFPSEIYSINSVQYDTNTTNVNRFNRTFDNSLKRNVHSSITSSNFYFHKRQFSISSSQNYCKNDQSEKSSNKKFWPMEYGDELKIGFASLFDIIGIWINIFKIQSNYMPTFDKGNFLEGSKIAIESLTKKIAEGDFDSLRGLVTDELFDRIKECFGGLSYEERQKFIIKKDEIVAHGIKSIDIIEDDDGTSIEILVISHAVKNLNDIEKAEFKDEFLNDNLYVLNYRFVKDVTDEDWTVSLMIHSRLSEEIEEQKKKITKHFEKFQGPFSKKE